MPPHILKVSTEHEGLRLDVFLVRNLPDVPSRTFVKKLIDGGHVQVNQNKLKAHAKVHAGDEVSVEIPEDFLPPDDIEPEDIPLDIFYEDDYLLIVNKPAGLLVHPAQGIYSGTLVNALLAHSRKLSDYNTPTRPGIVHRLDQETSGLMVVAKDNKTHVRLADQFQKHKVRKSYLALVEGEIEFDEGVIDAPLGRHIRRRDRKAVDFSESAKEAETYYRVLKRHKGVTLVALFPKTGRTHQLRVHMSHLGHSILGDTKYGRKENFPRLALHAQALGFVHPKTKAYVEFSTRPPQEFLAKVR